MDANTQTARWNERNVRERKRRRDTKYVEEGRSEREEEADSGLYLILGASEGQLLQGNSDTMCAVKPRGLNPRAEDLNPGKLSPGVLSPVATLYLVQGALCHTSTVALCSTLNLNMDHNVQDENVS